MAECMSGLGLAAGAALGKETFDYNRDNFLGDRDQRKEKEFKTMDMRIEQSKQWREDVEDLISITEKKMHIYNLTTILLVLVTIFLWCEVEDTLSFTTPSWLFCGFALANTGAFMFLMLSIWFAVYSAVVAQGYNVRLRTQMVRLPIPSWQELEACRTYGSQFESVEGRQMFRVPFLMGKQENLAKSNSPPTASTAPPSSDTPGEQAAGGTVGNADATAEFADPWGLERKADNITGLGCPLGAEVANLRHIKMTRQAATLWQAYDGFSRVSLCIGINQLILSISYYFLAYLVVDVKCRVSGSLAVLTLIVLADGVLKLEISLQDWQLRVAQFLGVLGPIAGLIAAHATNLQATDLSVFVGSWCIPIAFLCHGIYLLFMTYLCRVVVQPNGARVPASFKQRMFLDPFAWASPKEDTSAVQDSQPTRKSEGGQVKAPAMDAINYGAGGTRPFLPQDLAPDAHSDMRFEDGACDPGKRLQVDKDVRVPFYHWGFDGLESSGSRDVVTGHEAEAPGVFPWKIFNGGMMLLAMVWMIAFVWRFEAAFVQEKSFVRLEAHAHKLQVPPRQSSRSLLAVGEAASSELAHHGTADLFRMWALSFLGDCAHVEMLQTTWPRASISPRSLSCDASGHHLIVTDGLLTYAADLSQGDVAHFEERQCAGLVGENVQDAAVLCGKADQPCQALVLHRNGRRVAACPLDSKIGAKELQKASKVSPVSEAWLERHNASDLERLSSIAVKPFCEGGLQHCAYARTTHGRVVQLRQRSDGQDLIPADILREEEQGNHMSHLTVRAFNQRYLGVLQPHRQSIEILDSNDGGISIGKLLVPPTVHATSWCAGAGHLFMLSGGEKPQIWRMPLPQALSAVPRA